MLLSVMQDQMIIVLVDFIFRHIYKFSFVDNSLALFLAQIAKMMILNIVSVQLLLIIELHKGTVMTIRVIFLVMVNKLRIIEKLLFKL
jgi:hypothetical protein